MLRVAAAVLVVLLLAAASLWAASPALVAFALPRLLAPYGVVDVRIDAARPRLDGTTLHALALRQGEYSVTMEGVELGWRLAGLRAGRLESVTIARLDVAIAASDTPVVLDVPPFWDLIPAKRVDVPRLTVRVADPAASLDGRFDFDATHARAAFTVESPLLPAALGLDARLGRDGRLSCTLREAGAAEALLDVHGAPTSAGRLDVDGTLALAGAPLAFFAALAGIEQMAGRVDATFDGAVTWPLPATWQARDAAGRADATLELEGRLPAGPSFGVRGALEAVQSDDGFSATLRPKASFTLKGLDVLGLRAGTTRIATTAPAVIALPANASEVQIAVPGVDLSTLVLRRKGAAVRFGKEARLAFSLDAALPWPLPTDPLAAARADLAVDVAIDAALEGFPAEVLDVTGHATAHVENGRVAARVDEGFAVNATGIAEVAEGVRVPEVAVTFGAPLSASSDVGAEAWRVSAVRIDVAVPEVHAAGQRLSFRRARLEDLVVASQTGALSATTRLRTRSAKDALVWALEGQIAGDGNSGRVRAAIDGKVARALLKAELGGYQSAYDLDAGTLAASFDGAWHRSEGALAWTGQGRLALADGIAHAGETTLEGIAFDVPLALAADGVSAGPARIAAAGIDVGVPLRDVGAGVHVTSTQAVLTGIGATILGGRAAIERIEYPFAGTGTSFELRLEGLSLAQVLALEGEDIAGEGVVDATLPVRLEGTALTIENGRVAARPPGGAIRYKSSVGAAARATPGLGLALDALADFAYSRLEADANYAADGTLNLLVTLQGRNPAVEKGRAIHFNLNVTENIPTLLRALRAGDAVTERVQEQFTR